MKKQIEMNYENMMKIDDKYQDLVTDIVCYIRAELTEYDAEEAINDINEILLGAQERGEDLFQVVGDYKNFCNEVIKSYKENSKYYKLKLILNDLPIYIYMCIFFIALDIVTFVIPNRPGSFKELMEIDYVMTLAPIINSIIGVICASIIVNIICKRPTKNKNNKKENVLIFVLYVLVVSTMVLVGTLGRKIEIYTFKNTSIPVIVGFIIAAIGLIQMTKIFILANREKKKMKRI